MRRNYRGNIVNEINMLGWYSYGAVVGESF